MAASKKVIESSNRLRYVRSLERFHKSIVSYFTNSPELSHEGFAKKIENSLKLLNRVDSVDLYKGDLKDLENLVKKIIDLSKSEKEIDEIKEEIIYASNQLDKSKNAKRYKKDKHVKAKYDEW
jgi:hypothetical protein